MIQIRKELRDHWVQPSAWPAEPHYRTIPFCAMSTCLLNTSRDGDSTAALGRHILKVGKLKTLSFLFLSGMGHWEVLRGFCENHLFALSLFQVLFSLLIQTVERTCKYYACEQKADKLIRSSSGNSQEVEKKGQQFSPSHLPWSYVEWLHSWPHPPQAGSCLLLLSVLIIATTRTSRAVLHANWKKSKHSSIWGGGN